MPAVVGFVAIAVYTRLLSPKEYGQYIIVLTTVSMVSLFLFSWLNHSILRFFNESKDSDALPAFISTILTILFVLLFPVSGLWYVLTYFLRDLLGPDLTCLLNIGVWVLWAQAGYSLILIILRADRKPLTYSLFSSVDALGRVGLAVFLIYFFSLGADAILWAIVIVTGSIFLWGSISMYRRWGIRFCRPSRALFKKYALYGFPLALVGAGEKVLALSDRYLVGYFLDPGMVGVYAAGYDITSVSVGFLFTVLLLAAYPVLIQAYEKEGEDRVRDMLEDLLGVYFLALCPVTAGAAALSKEGVMIMLGKEFVSAGEVIPWVAGGIFFLGLNFCFNKPFQLKKKTKILMLPVILASVVNVALNIILIPRLGIKGAAIATLIAYFGYSCFTLWLSRKIFTWSFPWHTFAKTAFASSGMYVLLVVTKPAEADVFSVFARIFLGAVFYFALLFVLKERFLRRGLSYVASLRFSKRSLS